MVVVADSGNFTVYRSKCVFVITFGHLEDVLVIIGVNDFRLPAGEKIDSTGTIIIHILATPVIVEHDIHVRGQFGSGADGVFYV